MNPPDIEDFMKTLQDDSIVFSGNEIIDDLKLITIDQLLNKIPNYKGKNLLNFFECLKDSIQKMIEKLNSKSKSNKILKDKSMFNALLAQMHVTKQIVVSILFNYSKDKKLDLKKFLTEMKKSIINEESKKRKNNSDNKNNNKKLKKNDDYYDKYYENYEDDEDYYEDEDEEDDDVEDDEEEDDDEEENYEDNDDDDDDTNLLDKKIANQKMDLRKRENKDFLDELMKSSINDTNGYIYNYFSQMKTEDKNNTLKKLKEINNYQTLDKPLLFKLISLEIPMEQKSYILKKYLALISGKSESNKLKGWIDSIATIPFGINLGTSLSNIKQNRIKNFLENLQKTMDNAVWGHNEAKRHIIQIMGQQFRNPDSKGNNIGIWGPPGNGKSSLVKEGIAKAMNRPFVFISLGGATDSSFLEGHSYTYEGSIYGRIAQGIISSKCMNPIIYFDELDKISKTHKGDEITNILIHLTDPVQNSHFRDKYFHGIDFDLSKVTFIFSYNDPSLIDKVLMDRITQVETKYLLINQKLYVAQNYLIPSIMKEIVFEKN